MLFTLYELALNPEIQTKVRQEIRKALQKHGEITYEMMIDIPYLDQVINGKLSNIHVLPKHKSKNQFHFFNFISSKKPTETLRMYPPFTIVARMAGSDYKIPDTTIVLKKGVPIFIPVYAIHVSGTCKRV